ncbi:MAG: GTP cyclohydrolase I FolE2 [Parasporobacterium sp.]|nr:GTP cyclohydrolase I FolE2 [Parasporobacterium sp.]
MKDIQNLKDERNVYLNEVGIREVKYPVEIRKRDGSWYSTPVVAGLRVDLPGNQKGTHMSRFVEILQENNRLDLSDIKTLLEQLKERLEAVNSYVTMEFDWFIEKESPVSKRKSLLDVRVAIEAKMIGDQFGFQMSVNTPVTTLCPCSKEISDYSAHNQRANVIITIETCRFIWIEDLVKISEDSASSPLFSLLKRPDEKFVTEYAYDHPKFVEDVCRDVKLKLDEFEDIHRYSVEVMSHESIHNHQAYAKVISER